MAKFIEVTDRKYGDKMLINTNQIIYVCDGGSTTIRYVNDGDGEYVRCKETYETVKNMLTEGIEVRK